MNCKDVRPLLSQMIDGEISKDLSKIVEEHLQSCNDCAKWFSGMQSLNKLYGIEQAPKTVKKDVIDSVSSLDRISFLGRLAGFLSGNIESAVAAVVMLFAVLFFGVLVKAAINGDFGGMSGMSALRSYSDEREVAYEKKSPPGHPPVQENIQASKQEKSYAGSNKSKNSTLKSYQKIIKTANIEIKIKRKTAREKLETVMRIAEITGGYIVDSDLSKGDVSADATAVIRVPERLLKDVIAQLSKLGSVKKFTQSGRDVTNEYVDLQARIKQLKAEELAFRRLYDRASKISDLLQIQQNLSDVQTQIEQLQGQLNQLSEQVDFATINILLTEPKVKKIPSIFDIWKKNRPVEIGLNGLLGVVSFITIGVITFFPIILIAIITVLILRLIKRKQ